jgi:hypothetical protein
MGAVACLLVWCTAVVSVLWLMRNTPMKQIAAAERKTSNDNGEEVVVWDWDCQIESLEHLPFPHHS